eukprot:Mrub_00229.p1 GENE.Mrub_00229~~Mrub_00229.p1  ORF type:complete len:1325 (-),score=333.50 Mrub_00229:65-3886(-)
MTLDKVTDRRTALLNASLARILAVLTAHNYAVEQLHQVCASSSPSPTTASLLPVRKFLLADSDPNNMALLQNALALITNLIDGLIKPEDANAINLNMYVSILEHVFTRSGVDNAYIGVNYDQFSKTFQQIALIFFKDTTELIFQQSYINNFKLFISLIHDDKYLNDYNKDNYLNYTKLGTEIFSSLIDYAAEDSLLQFIDMMLNDSKHSILDLLDLSNDSAHIKVINYIIDKCIKVNSNIYSLDETYFDEQLKLTNRKYIKSILKNSLTIPTTESFNTYFKVYSINQDVCMHYLSIKQYCYDQSSLDLIENLVSSLVNNFNNTYIEYDYLCMFKELMINLTEFIVNLKNYNYTKVYKITDSCTIIKKVLSIFKSIFMLKMYDLLPMFLDSKILDHFYIFINNLIKKYFSNYQDEYNPYGCPQVDITHSESVFLQAFTQYFKCVLDLDYTHSMLLLKTEDQLIKLMTYLERLLDFQNYQVKNNVMDILVIALQYNCTKVYDFCASNEFREKIEYNYEYFQNNHNFNHLDSFYNDPYNFRMPESAYTWLIIKKEINNIDKPDDNYKNYESNNQFNKHNNNINNLESNHSNPIDNITMPTDNNNKFKRSRDRSKSSKSHLHDKENNSIESNNNTTITKEIKDITKDLPPIKKKSNKVNEIKDIDLNYVNNRSETIKTLQKLNKSSIKSNNSENDQYSQLNETNLNKNNENNIPSYPANSILNRKDSISSISSKQSNRRPRSAKSASMLKYITNESNIDHDAETKSTNNKDILFGQTLHNFDRQNDKYIYSNQTQTENYDLSQLLNMFPQLKNMDQESLLKLLQTGKHNASMDSESRVIYTQTSFYKESNPHKSTLNQRSELFSNDFTSEHYQYPANFTTSNALSPSKVNTQNEEFYKEFSSNMNHNHNGNQSSPNRHFDVQAVSIDDFGAKSNQHYQFNHYSNQQVNSNNYELSHNHQEDYGDVDVNAEANYNYMYKQISMKDIIDENSRNRPDDSDRFNAHLNNLNINNNNKSLLDKVDGVSTNSNFKPLIKKKDDLLSNLSNKTADSNVVRLNNLGYGTAGVSSSKMLKTRADNLNPKNKIDVTISDASTNAISSDKENLKDREREKDTTGSNNTSPKKKFMFKTISKVYFADHREVGDLMENSLMYAYFSEHLCENKEQKSYTKKLRIRLGINQTQGQMIPKKLGLKQFVDLVSFFINVTNKDGLNEFNSQIQYVLTGMNNCEKLVAILGNVALNLTNNINEKFVEPINEEILKEIKLGYWKNLEDELTDEIY